MTDAQLPLSGSEDGAVTAIVAAPPRVQNGGLHMTLDLPRRFDGERAAGSVAGRFVLARCCAQGAVEAAEQWSIYLRRPLFVMGRPRSGNDQAMATWQFCTPSTANSDAGYRWLAQRRQGDRISLTGPFGNGFPLPPGVRRLLLVAEPDRLAMLTPLIEEGLDRGGQVSVLLLEETAGTADVAGLRAGLPLTVELHTVDGPAWHKRIADGIRWSNQVCAALPPQRLALLAEAIHQTRMRLDSGFVYALVDADLVCGYGACLACTVPLASGSLTRACVHGPVFDLLELAGKG